MKTTAILNDADMCLGLRIAGVDTHHVKTEDELSAALDSVSITDTGLLIISEAFANSAEVIDFAKKYPQLLISEVDM